MKKLLFVVLFLFLAITVSNAQEQATPQPQWFAVAEDEVLSFKDYGTHVVVVTTDGQKLTGAIKAE